MNLLRNQQALQALQASAEPVEVEQRSRMSHLQLKIEAVQELVIAMVWIPDQTNDFWLVNTTKNLKQIK